MKNSIISVPSISGFIFGLVGLPLIKIGALFLFFKVTSTCGFLAGVITLIGLVYIIVDYIYPSKKDAPKKNENANKFLKGFAFGVIVLFMFLIVVTINAFGELGLGLQDLRDLF